MSVAFAKTKDEKDSPSMAGENGIPAKSNRVGAISIERTGTVTLCFAVMFGPLIQNGTWHHVVIDL